MSMHSIQTFVDRIFLIRHSADEMAAALPAGIMSFTVTSFFIGTIGYVNTFVAQYIGAGRDNRVGPATWQGIYLALFAGGIVLLFIPLTEPLFRWFGHAPEVMRHEATYFRILCIASVPMLITTAGWSFYTGRGLTKVVLYVSMTATCVNIFLDYCLIGGRLGFPEWGIAGAAWATTAAHTTSMILFAILFFRRHHRRRFGIANARIDFDLLGRILRFGAPAGTQFMLDMTAFTLFMVFVGRISTQALLATNIAFEINFVALIPMFGFGTAVSILVGQAQGREEPHIAQRSTWSAFSLTFAYMALLALGLWQWPEVFLFPFSQNAADPQAFAEVVPLIKHLLCFVAIYCLFDTANIVFAAALKGAGDTRFVMIFSVTAHWLLMTLPCWLAIKFQWGPVGGLYVAWGFLTLFICILAVGFVMRFRQGKWKTMRVIEQTPSPPLPLPEVPTVELESP
jgi:MATE family multidrug resistance protein